MSANPLTFTIRIDTTELRQVITETLTEHGLALKYPAPSELIDALKEAELRIIEDWMRVI